MRPAVCITVLCSQFFTCAKAQVTNYPFKFKDAARSAGLLPPVAGIYGHGAAWGDADGDGYIDLYVGTFAKEGKGNIFFKNVKGKFVRDQQKTLNISSRTTGIVFADLDNDGDADLYVGSMPQDNKLKGNTLFENTGKGNFKDISTNNGSCPVSFGGRSVAVLDFDGDGLLDILAGEDPLTGYNGSATRSSRLFRNKGKLQFEDVSASAGLPAGIPGYGVAAADVNNDGWPDFFLAANNGGNLLFLNDKKGKFYEAPGTRKTFEWAGSGGDNMVCGISFGDVNRDGLLDIVMGPHFEEPWVAPQPIRLFLNKGIKEGKTVFEENTKAAGLKPIPLKAPHVEIQDFDNDGLPDIYTTVVKFKNGNVYPLIFRQIGSENGVPQFKEEVLAINDFPTREDKAFKGQTGPFFAKLLKEKKIIYTAPGPTGDYDNDGRLDMFLPSWWPEVPSMLLHNETIGGNWLRIQVVGSKKLNRMGVGSKIRIYRAGTLGQPSGLLGCQDISAGYGYASGQVAIAHFGLGKEATVDVEISLPHGSRKLVHKNVKVNRTVVFKE